MTTQPHGTTSGMPPSPSSPRRAAQVLRCFCVFNPNISHSENSADENILWFYPPETPVEQQLRTVGLCTAFTTLAGTFGAERLSHASTAHLRYIAEEMESDFWFATVFQRCEKREDTFLTDDDDRDDGLVDGIKGIMRRCYAMLGITMGSLTSVLAAELSTVQQLDPSGGGSETSRRREKLLLPEASRRVKVRIEPLCYDFSRLLDEAVSSPRGSFGVTTGVNYVAINVSGHLQLGSFSRRLHNAHPGTIAHSVLIMQPNQLVCTTLDYDTTATLLSFVHASEGEHGPPLPQAVFVQHGGAYIALRGKDAVAYCDALRGTVESRVAATATAKGSAPPTAMQWLKRLASRLGVGGDSTGSGSQQVALALEATNASAKCSVIAHDARTQCYINDTLMGVLCFTRGVYSLYCLVENKFCEHALLRQGLIESVAAIVLEEASLLGLASSSVREISAPMDELERQALFSYRNAALSLVKVSSHFKNDSLAHRYADTITQLDRLRHAAPAAENASEVVSLAARLHDSLWGFSDSFGLRDFCFALIGERASAEMTTAMSQAGEVRAKCLVGLQTE